MLIVFVAAAVSFDFICHDAGAEDHYRCKKDLSEVNGVQKGLGNAAPNRSLEERAVDDRSEEVQEYEDNRSIEYRPRGDCFDDTAGLLLGGIVDDVVDVDIKGRRYAFEHVDVGECLARLPVGDGLPRTVFIRCLLLGTIAESVGAIPQLRCARRVLISFTFVKNAGEMELWRDT